MRRFSLLFLALACVLGLQAQQDPNASRLLKTAKNKVNSLKSFEVSFKKSLRTNNGKTTGTGYGGSLQMQGNKFRVKLQDQIVICDGKTQWAVNTADQEVSITAYDPKDGFTPDRLFQFSQENMKTAYFGTQNLNSEAVELVELVPLQQADYFKVKIWFAKSDNYPRQVEVYNRNGSIVKYEMGKIQPNKVFEAAVFTYNKAEFPGYYVEDLRQ